MASVSANSETGSGIVTTLTALVAGEGATSHSFFGSDALSTDRWASRNLADVVHHLCTLHGRHPGVIDHAATRTGSPEARKWVVAAVDGFAVERNFLTKLVVAAGPLPSTPGQAESEAAVNGQRHALEMLARSDREGCAIGAAATLVIDWAAVRPILLNAANRFSVEAPASKLPSVDDTLDMIAALVTAPAVERAITFGAQQLLAQHHGLYDLLEARKIARGEF